MRKLVFAFLALGLVPLANVGNALAQNSLSELRERLIAPWLVTVQGEPRTRIFRINEIAQTSDGDYLLNATYGWTEGEQNIVRVELIQLQTEVGLIIRTALRSLISVRPIPGGNLAGTFRFANGVEKSVTLEKLTEDQVPLKMKEALATIAKLAFANEDKDWGISPTTYFRTDKQHSPTPTSLPGARTVRTMELRQMMSEKTAPTLIDVLDGSAHGTIPGALWWAYAGDGVLGNAGDAKFEQDLERISKGDKTAPLVFFCLSSECWRSYNAGLRAMKLGYTNVYWYRGGVVSWRNAGLDTAESQPYKQ